MEVAVICGAVAEEGDADVVAASLPRAHADADRVTYSRCYDAVGAEQPDRLVVEMHRAAATAADAVGLAEQFRHHAAGIGALGERMSVAAMRRRHPVGPAKMGADSDAGRFLADIEMQKARRFALAAGDLRDAFETTQEDHALEEVEENLSVRQVGAAFGMIRSRSRSRHPSLPSRRAATMLAAAGCHALAVRIIDYNSIMSTAAVTARASSRAPWHPAAGRVPAGGSAPSPVLQAA